MLLLLFTVWCRGRAMVVTLGLCSLIVLPVVVLVRPPSSVTLTVQLLDLPDPSPVETIQVFAGACVLAEATPSPTGSARFTLPTGTYTVSAASDDLGREVGWLTEPAVVHLAGAQTVRLGATFGPSSDLDAIRPPLPLHCRNNV